MEYYAIYGLGVTGQAFLDYLQKSQILDSNIIIGDNIPQEEFINILDKHKSNILYTCIAPSVPHDSILVKYLTDNNINYGTDINYTLSHLNQNKLIAITGSNGKSTITAWLADCLGVSPYGNIGTPLINKLNNTSENYSVCELSSYQLCHDADNLKPHIAIITNIMPDHINWHGDFEHYKECKHSITKSQDTGDYLLIADPSIYNSINTQATKILISLDSISNLEQQFNIQLSGLVNNIQLIGNHNKLNALCVLVSLHLLGKLNNNSLAKFKAFAGLEYRLEYLGQVNNKNSNIHIYNDSKSTNPESTITALNSFKPQDNVCLILGGRDKETNLEELIQVSSNITRNIIVFGEAQTRFVSEYTKYNYTGNIHQVNNLQEAYTLALTLENTKTIVFSPACSSFDQFTNYIERGRYFSKITGL